MSEQCASWSGSEERQCDADLCCYAAGPPQLMMAFTSDGQLKEGHVADRDRYAL